MTDLAVVMVTWNVRDLVLEALRSLFDDLNANGPSAVVYVVDSASADGTADAVAEAFPQVKLIRCEQNVGFVRANNLALRDMGFTGGVKADVPRAVYLLNPDTVTQPGATRALYDALMSDSQLGLVGARLSYGDGSFQHSAFMFPGLRQVWTEFFWVPGRLIDAPFNGRYLRSLYDAGQPFRVDFVLGATMMLKREIIEQTGGFDEGFFMYCEEIDWAWRIHKAGWTVKCVPAAHVVHLGGQSTAQARPESLKHLWTSRLRLFKKHFPPWKAFLARRLVAKGMRWRIHDANRLPREERVALIPVYREIYQRARGR